MEDSEISVLGAKDCIPGSGCDPDRARIRAEFDDLSVVCDLSELAEVPFFTPDPVPPAIPPLPPVIHSPMAGTCVDVRPVVTRSTSGAGHLSWSLADEAGDCSDGVYKLELELPACPTIKFVNNTEGPARNRLSFTPVTKETGDSGRCVTEIGYWFNPSVERFCSLQFVDKSSEDNKRLTFDVKSTTDEDDPDCLNLEIGYRLTGGAGISDQYEMASESVVTGISNAVIRCSGSNSYELVMGLEKTSIHYLTKKQA